MAADSAAMFRRMSFDRGGDPAGVPRLHLILCRSATVVQTSPQAGSGTGEEQEDEQMGEGKASSSQHDRIRCIASCCRFLHVRAPHLSVAQNFLLSLHPFFYTCEFRKIRNIDAGTWLQRGTRMSKDQRHAKCWQRQDGAGSRHRKPKPAAQKIVPRMDPIMSNAAATLSSMWTFVDFT